MARSTVREPRSSRTPAWEHRSLPGAGDDGRVMTSLLSATDHPTTHAGGDARHRRPLVLLATLGGAVAAGSTLLVCLAVGVVGWFVTDAGAHGAPRDGLRAGA